jgi:hypothetical protein
MLRLLAAFGIADVTVITQLHRWRLATDPQKFEIVIDNAYRRTRALLASIHRW